MICLFLIEWLPPDIHRSQAAIGVEHDLQAGYRVRNFGSDQEGHQVAYRFALHGNDVDCILERHDLIRGTLGNRACRNHAADAPVVEYGKIDSFARLPAENRIGLLQHDIGHLVTEAAVEPSVLFAEQGRCKRQGCVKHFIDMVVVRLNERRKGIIGSQGAVYAHLAGLHAQQNRRCLPAR